MNLDQLLPDDAKLALSFETWSTKAPDGVKWSTLITGADLKAAIRKEIQKHITDFYKELVDSGNIKL